MASRTAFDESSATTIAIAATASPKRRAHLPVVDSIEAGTGCASLRHSSRRRLASRATPAAMAAPRCGASLCIHALNQHVTLGRSFCRSTVRVWSSASTSFAREVLPAPHGAEIASDSGVPVPRLSMMAASASA
jgi:hypothetical protein